LRRILSRQAAPFTTSLTFMRRECPGSTNGGSQADGRSAGSVRSSTGKTAVSFTGSMRAICIWFSDLGRTVSRSDSASRSTARHPATATADVDADGQGVVTGQRLYQLVRQSGAIADHTFEIRFLDPGVQAYAFTFG
jgi:Thioredoxin like C-terminal domain